MQRHQKMRAIVLVVLAVAAEVAGMDERTKVIDMPRSH